MDCCEERGVARHKGLSQVGTPGCPRWSQAVSCRCSAYREAAVTAVQMPLTPGYGETPLPHDELAALLPRLSRCWTSRSRALMFMTSNRAFRTRFSIY